MKIDLHVHCSEYSACARSTAKEAIEWAIGHDMNALVFTNHWRFIPPSELAFWNRQYYPFRVFNGIEVSTLDEDFLIYGVLHEALATEKWTYPDLWQFVKQRDGFLILAHPFRFRDYVGVDLKTYPPDAVECASTNITTESRRRIAALAQELKVPVTCASDAHQRESVGKWYIEFAPAADTEHELAAALRRADFACRYGNGPAR